MTSEHSSFSLSFLRSYTRPTEGYGSGCRWVGGMTVVDANKQWYLGEHKRQCNTMYAAARTAAAGGQMTEDEERKRERTG